MSVRALLFDLDGTLIDSDPLHFEAYHQISARYGVTFDEDFFSRHISGHTNATICAKLYPSLSVAEHERIGDEKEDLFRALLAGQARAIPGVQAAIAWGRAHDLKLAIVSNAPPANVTASVAALGLDGAFAVEIYGGLVAKSKPDPMPYREALARLGVSADQAVAFEDTPLGVRAAVGADIATVGLTTTQSPDALMTAGATLTIADFEDTGLIPFLSERIGAR
jgi:HAD superfamily hydrolase (TIGR01509 family)